MITPITLLEAQRLKDAGYSRCSNMIFDDCSHHEGESSPLKLNDGRGTLAGVCTSAPNSDELIAAIQERWGEGKAKWLKAVVRFHPDTPMYAHVENTAVDLHEPWLAEAPTLLSALIDLYCKLNEV